MSCKLVSGGLSVVLAAAVLATACGLAAAQAPKLPGIEGTYKFVSRDLPDGTKQSPPQVAGLLTFAKGYRNFNICWAGKDGKKFSISYVASYKLTDKEYGEKSIYMMVNDEIGGKGITYDMSGPSGAAPVSIKDGRIEIKLPLYDEPKVVFAGKTLTATKEGQFVDHWERID